LGRVSIKWTEADGDLQMLDRDILVAGPQPQPPAYPPAAVEARIEVESAVNQRDCRLDILSKVSEHRSDTGDRARIAGRGLQRAVGVAERRTAMGLWVSYSANGVEMVMADRRKGERRAETR